jgi:hypothetical protein
MKVFNCALQSGEKVEVREQIDDVVVVVVMMMMTKP